MIGDLVEKSSDLLPAYLEDSIPESSEILVFDLCGSTPDFPVVLQEPAVLDLCQSVHQLWPCDHDSFQLQFLSEHLCQRYGDETQRCVHPDFIVGPVILRPDAEVVNVFGNLEEAVFNALLVAVLLQDRLCLPFLPVGAGELLAEILIKVLGLLFLLDLPFDSVCTI